MDTLLILLASYGLCFGLMNEKVSVLNRVLYALPLFREEEGNLFQRMFKCSYCTGFHAGWMTWTISSFPEMMMGSLSLGDADQALLVAFASSVFCYSVDTIIQWFER